MHMNKELKYRAWNSIVKRMQYFTLPELEQQKSAIQWQNITIMTCLGHKDKNGKEYYEGDIVRTRISNNELSPIEEDSLNDLEQYKFFAIVWNGSTLSFRAATRTINGICPLMTGFGDNKWRGEIVGNIYENPHLI